MVSWGIKRWNNSVVQNDILNDMFGINQSIINISDWKYTITSQIEMIAIEHFSKWQHFSKIVIFYYIISMTQIWIVSLFEAQLTTVVLGIPM